MLRTAARIRTVTRLHTCHTWLQLKHDTACIEHLQISIHWTQTNWIHTPFTHCSSDSNSRLCFHSVLLGPLQLPTRWLSSFSLADCRKFRAQLPDLSVRQKKTWPCPTHSSVLTLASNQGTNTVQNLHALLRCNHRHWTTIPLRTSPSLHSL